MRDQPDLPLSPRALRVLREDQPSERELQSAYQRFMRKPQRRSPSLLVSGWVFAGLVLGLGVAFGAEAVVQRMNPPLPLAPPNTPLSAPRSAHVKLPYRAPSADQTTASELSPELPTSPQQPPLARPPSSVNPKALASDSGEPAPANSEVWAKAAEGLRHNDVAETEAALAKVEHSGSTTDREAARLIRAQLMLHQGDSNGARALLRDLADNAQSEPVRAKARSLLGQSSAKSNSALNAAPSGT